MGVYATTGLRHHRSEQHRTDGGRLQPQGHEPRYRLRPRQDEAHSSIARLLIAGTNGRRPRDRGNDLLMRDHIQNIICDGDQVRFNYLMRWLARMFQHPAEQGEVAVFTPIYPFLLVAAAEPVTLR
jgi:hypothetical protein